MPVDEKAFLRSFELTECDWQYNKKNEQTLHISKLTL